jgi:hypothetical protein
MPSPAFPLAASPIDFVTLDQVKTWIQGMVPFVATPDDDVLQFIITATSQDMLTMMSRETILSADYQEWYDGSGSATLALDQAPINSVTTLKANGVVAAPSSDHVQNGYIISRDKKFIQLVGGGAGIVPGFGFGSYGISSGFGRRCGNVFPQGIANIYVDYNAGYTAVPYDAAEACLLIIDQDYKRRGWVDRAQIVIPQGGGTTTYRSWPIPVRAQEIINRYTRTYHP